MHSISDISQICKLFLMEVALAFDTGAIGFILFFFFYVLISAVGDSFQWSTCAFYQPFVFSSSVILLAIYQLPRTDMLIRGQLHVLRWQK